MNSESNFLGIIDKAIENKWKNEATKKGYYDNFLGFVQDLDDALRKRYLPDFASLDIEIQKARAEKDFVKALELQNKSIVSAFDFQAKKADLIVVISEIQKQLTKNSMDELATTFVDILFSFIKGDCPLDENTGEEAMLPPITPITPLGSYSEVVQPLAAMRSGARGPTDNKDLLNEGEDTFLEDIIQKTNGKFTNEYLDKYFYEHGNETRWEIIDQERLPIQYSKNKIKYYCTLERYVLDVLVENGSMTFAEIKSKILSVNPMISTERIEEALRLLIHRIEIVQKNNKYSYV